MKKALIFLIIFCFIPSMILASELKNVNDVEKFTYMLISKIQKNQIAEMFDLTKNFTFIPVEEIESAKNQIILKRKEYINRIGNPIGSVIHIETKTIVDSLIHIKYLEKCDRNSIIWNFTFYKPMDDWFLASLWSSDNILSLFGENFQ